MRDDKGKHGRGKRNGMRWWWILIPLAIITVVFLIVTLAIPPFDQLGMTVG